MSQVNKPTRILVIGGTGAQGTAIVPELVKDKKYLVTVLTRDVNNPSAKSLEALGNVVLLQGSYTVEKDLRTALKDQYGVFVNLNSFTMTEGEFYFWNFRIYDLAVQSGVKHFIYSSVPSLTKRRNYAEEYRVSHATTIARVGEWLTAQPTSTMGWTNLVGGFYAEMLSDLFAPTVDSSGTYIFSGLTQDGPAALFVELRQYAVFTRWAFDNPRRSIGRELSMGFYTPTLQEIADAFSRVTGHKARKQDLTEDEFFATEEQRRGIPVDKKVPYHIPDGEQPDDSRFTFRKSFGAFWRFYRSMTEEDVKAFSASGRELVDEIYPDRIKNIEEWMRAVNYDGKVAPPLKMRRDRDEKNASTNL